MRRLKLMVLVMIVLALGLGWSAAEARTLTQLGNHPFCSPPLKSPDDLRQLIKDRSDDLAKGFAKAGRSDLWTPLVAQLPTATIVPTKVQPGETFQWMLFRKNGKGPVRVAKGLTWGGKQPIEAYYLTIEADGQRYGFVVPLICGNFALKDVSPLPPPAPKQVVAPPPPPVNQAPLCRLTISKQALDCGEKITADAGQSSDPDGKVMEVKFILTGKDGKVVWEKVDSEPPFVQEIKVPCGTQEYVVSAVVTDDKGAQSGPAGCTQMVVAKPRCPGNWVLDTAFARMFDPASFAVLRLGYEIPLVDKLHLLAMVGGFIRINGQDGDGAVVLDAILNYHWFHRLEVGFGLGGWSGERGELDLIANVGVKLFEDPGLNGTVFFEARSATDQLEDLDRYGRYGLGLRFRF